MKALHLLPGLVTLSLFTAQAPTDSRAAQPQPNILVILADDLGRGDYSAFGTKDIRTPHIDRLCREGMTFENFYANSCVCSPSRAALLSGCYPDRVGVPGLVRHMPDNSWGYLSPSAVLLPKVLKAQGYHTAIVGKWNLGLESPRTATSCVPPGPQWNRRRANMISRSSTTFWPSCLKGNDCR